MSRNITPAVYADLIDPGSPHAIIAFLTLTHQALPQPINVVSDPVDYLVNGERFIGCPFAVEMVTDEERPPVAALRVQNVDRRIGEALRPAVGRIKAALAVRSLADFDLSQSPRQPIGPDAPIYAFQHFELADVTVTAMEVTGTLMLRDYTQTPWPGKSATQSRCPALFR